MSQSLYMPIPATIERIEDETPSIKTFTIQPSEPISFAAGQFVELTVPGVGEAPFTPSSSPAVTDRMDITIMRTGRVTDRLHQMIPGEEVGVRGPYGRGYPLEAFRDRVVVIAGGGCGAGPLRALILTLLEDPSAYGKLIVRYGARSPQDLVFRDAAERRWGRAGDVDVLLTVDVGTEGWDGHVGVLPTILTEQYLVTRPESSVAVMCGPPVMMRFTTLKLLERGFAPHDIYLSLERNMSCGVGKCGHCRLDRFHVCKDGPVFSYEEIESLPRLWDH